MIGQVCTHLFFKTIEPLDIHFIFNKKRNKIICIELCAVSSMAKIAAINVFLVSKIFVLKIQSCKIFDKFHVWV